MRPLQRAALIAVACLPLQACQALLPVFLIPGSTVPELRIGFGTVSTPLSVVLERVAVYQCRSVGPGSASGTWPSDAAAVWQLEGPSSEPLVQLRYGQVPAGAAVLHGAEALETPGCYVFRLRGRRLSGASENGSLGIRLSAAGQVTALSSGELEALFRPART